MHVLHAGERSSPLLLLLHGFPELSYSWRNQLVPLSKLGFFVVAPDQRGYGRTYSITTGPRPIAYDDDLAPFRMLNLVHDVVALVHALGHDEASAVVGHDFGSVVAAYSALARPDVVKAVVCMSVPFSGQPRHATTLGAAHPPDPPAATPWAALGALLAGLHPPRKHYTAYFSGPGANADLVDAPQGLHAFLRAYFHMKSADWPGNDPRPLADVAQVVRQPHYYVMPAAQTMPQAVGAHAPSELDVVRCAWLTEAQLGVYVEVFRRTGFQGGLNWYRGMRDLALTEDLGTFAGKKIDVPAMFLGGAKDWGTYMTPGSLEKMGGVCTKFKGVVLIDGAGHWVQQERAHEVTKALTEFLQQLSR
ncbi:hypothetical protein PHLGIDRAFT_89746 [Phlebiopsis gigantea 11061_1 CR5-6]|uniref:AB hydrolase-1 domain-containing protein n=1 Tax=Phlebiopsis gigantea (strain 11061_1 CR5-6) TaxID=745531 RepID=A0A0C3SAT6_PHLG1|nr:hypothetical protein PHLGIDRAFT_89746 [Phlebiopsis gigantea 11061_1 CR5-6]